MTVLYNLFLGLLSIPIPQDILLLFVFWGVFSLALSLLHWRSKF